MGLDYSRQRPFGGYTKRDNRPPIPRFSDLLLLGVLYPNTDKIMVHLPPTFGVQLRPS